MKKLILVRHAKSSWNLKNIPDIDRPLKQIGIIRASKESLKLEDKTKIDLVITSPAIRATHTAILFCRILGIDTKKILIRSELYGKPKEEFIKLLKTLPDDAKTVMIFSHEPFLTNITKKLKMKAGLLEGYKTSGIKTLSFPIAKWDKLKPVSGILKSL